MRAPLVALLGLGLAAAASSSGGFNGRTISPLRALRGGENADVAEFGHSGAPQKLRNAFKITVRAPPPCCLAAHPDVFTSSFCPANIPDEPVLPQRVEVCGTVTTLGAYRKDFLALELSGPRRISDGSIDLQSSPPDALFARREGVPDTAMCSGCS